MAVLQTSKLSWPTRCQFFRQRICGDFSLEGIHSDRQVHYESSARPVTALVYDICLNPNHWVGSFKSLSHCHSDTLQTQRERRRWEQRTCTGSNHSIHLW